MILVYLMFVYVYDVCLFVCVCLRVMYVCVYGLLLYWYIHLVL